MAAVETQSCLIQHVKTHLNTRESANTFSKGSMSCILKYKMCLKDTKVDHLQTYYNAAKWEII